MKNLIIILTLTILFSIFTYNTTSAEIVTDGLVSYWTFDKNDMINRTLKDVWGENNATIHGNPKSVHGKVGEAFKFDGVNDYIDLTTLEDFGEQLGKSTFEAWIKTTNSKDWMTLVNTNGDKCPYWGIHLNGDTELNGLVEIREGMVYFTTSLRRVDGRGCGGATRGSSMNIFDGEWHHLVYTLNYVIKPTGGSGGRIVYLDGVKRSTGTHGFGGNRAFFPFTAPVHLGARKTNGVTSSFFEGYIDEVRLYNHFLTADQVQQNYESRDPFNVEPKGKLATLWGKLKR